MAKTGMNLQDSFLNQVRKDNTEITLVMLDGARLSGLVRGFDNFTVILNSRGSQHLIYKHAIAQIVSRRASHGGEGEHGGEPQGGGHQGGEQRREPRGDQRPPRPQQSGGPGGAQPGASAQANPVAPTHPAGGSSTGAAGAQGGSPQAGSAPPPQQRQQGERRQDQGQQRRGEDPHSRDKFNTLDLSSLKVDESKPEA